MKDIVIKMLNERGVQLIDIAEIVLDRQIRYNPEITINDCLDSIDKVLEKREMQHAILVGINLDILAEKKMLLEPLQSIVERDEGLFGCDETLALGAVLIYGSIAATTFGHLDIAKTGIIHKLDSHGEKVNTFLDDLVASVAAAASARVAHRNRH